ncbi:MAG: inositol monophosphatase [Coxiella sp. DG_40]|jgi:myo-inositol-1(or 4)-monophosphatase|nr:MAG: inositol monophosphatase [Coxiella sp. DG_40]
MHAMVNIAISAVRSASKIIMRSVERLEGGRITGADRNAYAAEVEQSAAQEIIDIIHKAYPEHKIFKNVHEPPENGDYIWIIDAIDGIINYAHAFPHFSTSIAVKVKDKIHHAVVYDPIRQDLFAASRGEGAFLNERRIRVSPHKHIEGSLLGTGFPHKQPQHLKPYLDTFTKLFPQLDGVRRSGSSALDLAYVAAGRLEGFWEFSLKEWNMAAGVLLVKEAGGLVSDFQGEENYLESGNLIAGNPKIFKAILQVVQECLEE